ncbi:MAG: hypothetical protein JNL87_21320 [Burkholderiaceae bacterium]|nr:hypothetical protein [Burkholderiaceae bacterium]
MSMTNMTTLADQGEALEERFRQCSADVRAPEFGAVVADLHDWLARCIAHGRFLPPGSPDRRSLQGQVNFWTSKLRQLGRSFDGNDRIEPFDPNAGNVLPDELFPYHGLLAATGSGGKLFAGRDEQVKEYSDHIDGHPALLIQSESGGGKSSVAMAGVLPELRRRHPDWLVLDRVTPGTQPADTLREALGGLLSLAGVEARSVQAALAGRTVLVYVDQLEELLTMCTDVQQQQAFSDLLADLADAGVLRLLATMRVDHYERLAHSATCHRLYALLTRDGSVKTLPPMSLAQIRSVILQPAEAIGLRFVPASIVETLASETANAPSGLPLLQFALQRLWDERPRLDGRPDGPRLDMITAESFARLPTVSSALGRVADVYYAEMEAQGLVKACRRLMLELTVIDERLEVPLRRRRAQSEVLGALVSAELARPEQARVLVDGLVERRLLVRTGEGDAQQIEVAHEALFRYWGRFQDWINDDDVRATLRETRHISRDALRWDQSGRKADHLTLKGDPLERALRHLEAHWLEPLAASYVRACRQVIVDAENQRLQVLAAAEAAREQARRDKSRFIRLRLWGSTFVTVLIAGVCLFLWTRYQQLLLRNTTAIAYVLPQLPPAKALDLAYTLDSKRNSPESRASLAHAISQVGNATLVGRREDGEAGFTYSGQATVQLVATSQAGGKEDHALVRVMGPGLEDLASAVTVPLGLKKDESLASLDVGPPMARDEKLAVAEGDRLAVASVLATEGERRVLRAMRIFRVGKAPTAALVGELPFPVEPRPTQAASEIAFEPGGRSLAVSARLRVPKGLGGDQIWTQILQWTLGGPASADRLKDPDQAITALAFSQAPSPVLMKGRADGRVDCENLGYTESPDEGQPSDRKSLRVVKLKFGDATQFAAVHEDNSITVGDCGTRRVQKVELEGPDRPEQLAVWSVAAAATDPQKPPQRWLSLSYLLKGKLVCQSFDLADGSEQKCPGDGQSARGAVPAVDANGQLLGYRALVGAEPLMSFKRTRPAADAAAKDTARGAPVATLEPGQLGQSLAASPNGTHRLKIERQPGRDKTTMVFRTAEDGTARNGSAGGMAAILDPQWAAVNDQGVAVVLSSRRLEPRHQLSMFGPDDRLLGSVPTFPDAACLGLSPDGSQLIVASETGQFKRLAMNAEPSADAPASPGFESGALRDPVTACATGNRGRSDAVIVMATASGKVHRHDPETGTWRAMSRLDPFQLGGPALDVSIDGASRFIAVVSTRRAAACLDGNDGHLLRIWDLRLKLPEYPVASACIDVPLRSIGPLTRSAQGSGWVLPMYLQPGANAAGDVVARRDFACLACDVGKSSSATDSGIRQRAESLGATRVDDDELQEVYGIAP